MKNGRLGYLYHDADNGYELRQGDSHAWQDSYCIHMADGTTATVARAAQAVPAYAKAAVNTAIDIGTHAGAVLTEPDRTLFDAICGLDPQTRAGDPHIDPASETSSNTRPGSWRRAMSGAVFPSLATST